MENPIVPPRQSEELPQQGLIPDTSKSLIGPDQFAAQFDASSDFSALKRLQDPSKFKKAQFNARLYQK